MPVRSGTPEIFTQRVSVVDARDQIPAPEYLHGGACETHVEAGAPWEEHLVARLDPTDLGADGGDDAGGAVGLVTRGDDQPLARLGFLVGRLHDEVVVERLEREVYALGPFEHVTTA